MKHCNSFELKLKHVSSTRPSKYYIKLILYFIVMRILTYLLFILLISCNQKKISQKDHSLFWQKNSAEYVALCYQAFNIAKT